MTEEYHTMKRSIRILSAVLAALFLTASLGSCSLSEMLEEPVMIIVSEILSDGEPSVTEIPDDDPPETVLPDETEAPDDAIVLFPEDSELLAECRALFDAWQSVDNETFGLDVDWDTRYLRLYATEDAANGFVQEPPVKLALWSDFSVVSTANMQTDEGLWIDGTMSDLYPVRGVSDLSEIYDRLAAMLDESLFSVSLSYDLEQFDGVVYMIRGGRGYGGGSYDYDTACVVGRSETTREISVVGEEYGENIAVFLTISRRDDGSLFVSSARIAKPKG